MPPNDNDPLLEAIQEQFRQTIQEEDIEGDITQDDIEDATSEVIDSVGEDMYQQVRADDEGLQRLHETKADFETGIEERWGEPLELLERFIIWSQETGEAINAEYRLQAAQEQDFAFDALVRLHARAVQVAMEIHHLLKGGFADGAFARWRSLHEPVGIQNPVHHHRLTGWGRLTEVIVSVHRESPKRRSHLVGFDGKRVSLAGSGGLGPPLGRIPNRPVTLLGFRTVNSNIGLLLCATDAVLTGVSPGRSTLQATRTEAGRPTVCATARRVAVLSPVGQELHRSRHRPLVA